MPPAPASRNAVADRLALVLELMTLLPVMRRYLGPVLPVPG